MDINGWMIWMIIHKHSRNIKKTGDFPSIVPSLGSGCQVEKKPPGTFAEGWGWSDADS